MSNKFVNYKIYIVLSERRLVAPDLSSDDFECMICCGSRIISSFDLYAYLVYILIFSVTDYTA